MGGMTRLLLLLWAGVTVGSVVDLQKRIIGGKDCSKAERGYHAFLTFTKGNLESSCGGSLIHEQWILTAAHCWKDGWTVKVVLGPHTDHPTTVKIELKPMIYQDTDKSNTKKHDIMLLKLLTATTIPTVPLPELPVDCDNKPDDGKTVQIAGYYSKIQPGDIDDPDKVDTSKPLQCADTTVVKCDEVSLCLAASPYKYPLKQLLCFQDKKVDITGGDSGGGVVFKKMIYGVIVRGKVKACTGPAKAMDVCSYMPWISKTIAPESSG